MGQTKKRHYDRYTLDFKLQAVKLANHPKVRAIDIAESLGIHTVMLYRWQMEFGIIGDRPRFSGKCYITSIKIVVCPLLF